MQICIDNLVFGIILQCHDGIGERYSKSSPPSSR